MLVLLRMFIHSLFPVLNFMLLKFITPFKGLSRPVLDCNSIVKGNYPINHVYGVQMFRNFRAGVKFPSN